MADVIYNKNGLSSRENRVLEVFEKLESEVVSTETLRQLTGYDHKALHKTIQKLMDKNYITHATTAEVRFFKPDTEKLEEALESMTEDGVISEDSEII